MEKMRDFSDIGIFRFADAASFCGRSAKVDAARHAEGDGAVEYDAWVSGAN